MLYRTLKAILLRRKRRRSIERLIENPDLDCHQDYNLHITLTEEESLQIHTRRLRLSYYSVRNNIRYNNGGRGGIFVHTQDFVKRYIGFLHTGEGLFTSEYDPERHLGKFAAKEYERHPRLDKLIDRPEIDCHQGWHSSIEMTEEESLEIHTHRLLKHRHSLRKGTEYFHGGRGGVYIYDSWGDKKYIGNILEGRLYCPEI